VTVDIEEVPLEIEVRFDPQVTFAKHDEGRDVLNPFGFRCCSSEEVVGRSREPTLVEARKRHHIAIAQRQ
jgi:hypothetical protein